MQGNDTSEDEMYNVRIKRVQTRMIAMSCCYLLTLYPPEMSSWLSILFDEGTCSSRLVADDKVKRQLSNVKDMNFIIIYEAVQSVRDRKVNRK